MTIRAFYDRWPQYNRRLVETIAPLTDEQLAIRPSPDSLPTGFCWSMPRKLKLDT